MFLLLDSLSRSIALLILQCISLSINSNDALSLEYTPIESKSSKAAYKGEETTPVDTVLSIEFIPASKSYKTSKNSKTHEIPVEEKEPSTDAMPTPESKSSKSSPIEADAVLTPESKSSKSSPIEADAVLTPESKSSKSSLPIAPRSITLGDESTLSDESDSKVTESNEESGASAQQVSAVSVAALGAMLFL